MFSGLEFANPIDGAMPVTAQIVIFGVSKKKVGVRTAHMRVINGQAMKNAMEKNIQPVPSSFKAGVWARLGFYNIDDKKVLKLMQQFRFL